MSRRKETKMVATWSTPVLRFLTKLVGIILFVSGVVGLILGDYLLFGLLNIDLVEDIIHVVTGALLTYAGFRSSEDQLRMIVGVLGVLSLLAGILGFINPTLLGLIPHTYTYADNILHLTLGILGIFFAWVVRSPAGAGVASAYR
jgi:hypothetical protein